MVNDPDGGDRLHLSLYFHIPFCSKKCHYCHFYVLPDKEADKQKLMEAFKREWAFYAPTLQNATIATVYFGGGTPALFGPDRIAEILSWVKRDQETEITLEANPENSDQALLKAYAQAGINRLSIGVQTLDDPLLYTLGRGHGSRKAEEAVHFAKAAGIDNISIDLMYDLPGQTLQQWENTLRRASGLPITHLSLYNLTIEPHTLFFKQQEQLKPHLPDADVSLAMYQMALEELEKAHLYQYEISAFAHPGKQSKHNVGYWTARPFLGFGPSAYSYLGGHRFRNVASLSKYAAALAAGKSPVDFDEELSKEAQFRELLAIRLRLNEGVDLEDFALKHGRFAIEQTLEKLYSQGLLEQIGTRIRLTQKGILFYDSVAIDII